MLIINKKTVYCDVWSNSNSGVKIMVQEIIRLKKNIKIKVRYHLCKEEDYKNGIAYIELRAKTSATVKKGQKVYRQAKYSYSSTTQDVVTFRKFEDKSQSDVENKVVSNESQLNG